MLRVTDSLPPGFLAADAKDLRALLGGPTLIHLKGAREPAVFISILQHGNETTGWHAVQRLLNHYTAEDGTPKLPRSISLFVANVEAAEKGRRRLGHQVDYNRVWYGGISPESDEAGMMREIETVMQTRGVFASIDLHNNSGRHPLYACVNELDGRKLALASRFSRDVVYFINPTGVQSMSFGRFCPAVTLECGQADAQNGIEPAFEFLNSVIQMDEIEVPSDLLNDIRILKTVATIRTTGTGHFTFGQDDQGLSLRDDLDDFNFVQLPAGTVLGSSNPSGPILQVLDDDNQDVTDVFLTIESGEIRLKRGAIPAMLTKDINIILDDCLCYLMQQLAISSDDIA